MISNYLNLYNYQIIQELKKKKKTNKTWKGNKKGKKTLQSNGVFCLILFFFFIILFLKYIKTLISARIRPIQGCFHLFRTKTTRIGNRKKKKKEKDLPRTCMQLCRWLHDAFVCVGCGRSTLRAAPMLPNPMVSPFPLENSACRTRKWQEN